MWVVLNVYFLVREVAVVQTGARASGSGYDRVGVDKVLPVSVGGDAVAWGREGSSENCIPSEFGEAGNVLQPGDEVLEGAGVG